MSVSVKIEKVVIPTYEAGTPDKNPMFLEKRVYQGSSGRVYPHPVTESVSDEKTEKEYTAVFLENEYIQVMVLPEIGGRIQRLYDKTNGYDAVYYNEVIKPALVGLAGPWISGGIEFNWPQHHRPSTFDPVSFHVAENPDGSATCYVGEIEKMYHTKGMASFTVYPGKAYVEIKGQLYNPTDRTQTFLWWANPAVAVNDHTQSVFPPDVHAVMDHGKRDVSKFPIATGTYYKMDYSAGVDISRYKNVPVPTSYMAYHSDFDFVGNYDHGKKAGLLHIADHHISPGKKQWTWGNGDFGQAWDRNLTDENGPYIELMTGVFTDNQPDFTFIAPYEEKNFTQYFLPYKNAGAVKNASINALINLEVENGKATVSVYAPALIKAGKIRLWGGAECLLEQSVDLAPDCPFAATVEVNGIKEEALRLVVEDSKGNVLTEYTPLPEKIEETPEPAKASPLPEEISSLEELYLTALHLEQYRHATYMPDDYYLEGLKRDKTDIRLNNGYGKLLYNRGAFAESEPYFQAAVEKSTWKNPNPYDSEPYYNLGLSLKMQGRLAEAYDAFYKSTWSAAMQDRAFYQLALIAAAQGTLSDALAFAEQGLVRNAHNMKARDLKTTILRHLGRTKEAREYALETCGIDPMDCGSRYELYQLEGQEADLAKLKELLREDSHNYIELALNYIEAGCMKDAKAVLELFSCTDALYRYYCAFCGVQTEGEASLAYCFPNRLFDMIVLKEAIRRDPEDWQAPYLLGCLYYDKNRQEEAAGLWETSVGIYDGFPTVHRNLSLYYFNKTKEEEKALASMEKAFALDQTDPRIFYERDQLYKQLNRPVAFRLEQDEMYYNLVCQRDDLYTEYVALLNLSGQYQKALDRMMARKFHPWEGGEGKITAQYRISLMALAKADLVAGRKQEAAQKLQAALTYPHNLGEGKLAGATDNDIYYLLAQADPENREAYLALAVRGAGELSSAMYYNDQPPELFYYQALALELRGEKDKAKGYFNRLVDYGEQHINRHMKIDYFAVSLPDFLIYEGDLDKKNRVHCCYLAALGYLGLGNREKALRYAEAGLAEECAHAGLVDLMRELS